MLLGWVCRALFIIDGCRRVAAIIIIIVIFIAGWAGLSDYQRANNQSLAACYWAGARLGHHFRRLSVMLS
jgi:hypothetical protein